MRIVGASVIVSLLLSLGAARAMAEGKVQTFVPARIKVGENSSLSFFQCPERGREEDHIAIYCQARIATTGEPSWTFCFAQEAQHRRYEWEANKGLDRAHFSPASVDEQYVAVVANLLIIFSWQDDGCEVIPVPNWGFNSEAMGAGYISPQEILSGGGWIKRARLFDVQKRTLLAAGTIFSLSVMVSAGGIASDARLEKNFRASEHEIRKSLRAIERSRFIPGFYKGRPHPMRYFEVLYVGD